LESLHERIHRYRRKRGFTQTAVAKRMGMNLSTYRLRETTDNITCKELLQLADILQVDVIELMLGEEYYLRKMEEPKKQIPTVTQPTIDLKKNEYELAVNQNRRNIYKVSGLTHLQFKFWKYFLSASSGRQKAVLDFGFNIFNGKQLNKKIENLSSDFKKYDDKKRQ